MARPSTRRYLKGELTREQILHAAKKLFTQNGYHNTSIYDLFQKAGITKGAFYHHWRTKEDLALTILEEVKQAYMEHIYPVLEQEGRAREKIERTLKTIEELNAKPDWCYCKLLATWSSELSPEEDELGRAIHELRTRWLSFWEHLVHRAQEEGDMRKDIPPQDLSLTVVSAIFGVCLQGKSSDQLPMHHAMETLRKLLLT
ncbi:MAG: TetR/AcrR family transcriptional regulator [Planctomycetota bacterium]|nr:TetR/AcrR family transcriptional regulator [Planctomycetota bacterium]